MATVTLTDEEQAAAAALAGDGSVSEVAAGPADPRYKALDPAVADRELKRLERLRVAGENPDPSAEEKLKEDWRPPKKKKGDPPSELQDHKVGVADSNVMLLEGWGTAAIKGRVVIQLKVTHEDGSQGVYTFETQPAFGRDLSNRILATAAKAQGQLQGIVPETDGNAG